MSDEIKIENKEQSLKLLNEMFKKWDNFLSKMTPEEASTKSFHKNRTIKDDIAHLYLWQRITNARIEAGIENSSPNLDFLPKNFDIEGENADPINEWIYMEYVNKNWTEIYTSWKNNFLELIKLVGKCDEKVLLAKFEWIQGYPLMAVVSGTYEHHKEHIEKIL